MSPARRLGWLLVVLPVAASGCFDDPASAPDAALDAAVAPKDLPDLLDKPDAGAPDLPASPDAFDVSDVSDVSDVTTPDLPEVSADLGPRCATSAECSDGRLCGPDGRCAPCVPSDDRCPAAQEAFVEVVVPVPYSGEV